MRRGLVLAVPVAWNAMFVALPLLLIVKIAVSLSADTAPPYLPLATYADGTLQLSLHDDNFRTLWTDSIYRLAYGGSLQVAAITTVLCLLVGYPLAYALARSDPRRRTVYLTLVVIPFWTSFLIRIYAWIGLLKDDGLLNQLLQAIGLTHQPLQIMNTSVAVYIGMTYCYLPFMVLPLFATLEKLDATLREAAADLGAYPIRAFISVTLPLSSAGVLAGCLLVFVPAMGEYLVPKLLGGATNLMIASVLWDVFFIARDWPLAAAATVTLVLGLAVVMMVLALANRRPAATA